MRDLRKVRSTQKRKVARRDGRRWRRIALGVFLLLVVGLLYAAPTFGKLSGELDRLNLPGHAELIETERSGNVICFDTCPHLSRTYSFHGDTSEVERDVVTALKRAGYQVFIKEPGDYRPSFAIGKRYQIDWSVFEGESEQTMVQLTIRQKTG